MTPAHAHSPRIAARTVCSAPVTALSQVPGTGWAVAAAARDLVLLSLENCLHSPTATQPDHARWTLFQRERIHRIVWRPQAAGVLEGDRHEALILGGKEVALVQVDLKASCVPSGPMKDSGARSPLVVQTLPVCPASLCARRRSGRRHFPRGEPRSLSRLRGPRDLTEHPATERTSSLRDPALYLARLRISR